MMLEDLKHVKIDFPFIWKHLNISHLICDVGWKHCGTKQYFRIPEWRATLSIRCRIHFSFCSQISVTYGDGRGKKFQPLRWRVDSLASISVFRGNSRTYSRFAFQSDSFSFPERLSHSEENERRRVGTFRWKIDLVASKIWPFRYNAPVHWKCTRSIFLIIIFSAIPQRK